MDEEQRKIKRISTLGIAVSVRSFENGGTEVTRLDSPQLGMDSELRVPWLRLYLEFLVENGVDVEQSEFKLPGGFIAHPYWVEEDGGQWNWRIAGDR